MKYYSTIIYGAMFLHPPLPERWFELVRSRARLPEDL